ncbi:MAG TPA: HDOD domain-containing protein [Deltaproteobacteria bacterium]|nr:HDOD domain-containing protein [Deltaproteobacteria bacterium]
MTVGVEEISDEGLGSRSNERFVEAAVGAARGLAERDPEMARWTAPLVRAIKRRRLRLPSLSPTVHRVVKLIESQEVDLDELADAVSGDPVLATRIMGVANSSYFRGATEVPNVRDALMRMGVREARTIVIVVALRATVMRSPGLGDMASVLWKHSLLAASATQEITAELPPWETAGFLAGLVHDLGKLVVLAFAAELPAWQDDGAEPGSAVVEAMMAATHAELGAMVLASWAFPEPFCEAVLLHHDASQAVGDAGSLAIAVEVGNRIASQIEQGWPEDAAELDETLVERATRLGVDPPRLSDIAMEAETNFEALSKLG